MASYEIDGAEQVFSSYFFTFYLVSPHSIPVAYPSSPFVFSPHYNILNTEL
jgi:hypothetical protein